MKKGIVFTLLGGLFWGFSDVCAQFVFSRYDLPTAWMIVIRMFSAGLVLTVMQLIRHPSETRALLTSGPDMLRLGIFAIFGLMMSQFTTYQTIHLANAGTATVLQATAPAFILILVCLRTPRLPNRQEGLAVFLAIFGTFLIATHGRLSEMAISPAALFWGFLSAMSAVFYTTLSGALVRKWGSIAIMGPGLLMGGCVLTLITRVWTYPLELGPDGWLGIAGVALFGTILAFNFYVAGVAIVGPVKGSLLGMIEPVSATVLAVLWLKSKFEAVDLLGFACILTTVTLLALRKNEGD